MRDIDPAHEEDYRGYHIALEYDTDAMSPKEWDQLGTFVTWHRNYVFDENGQKTWGSPQEFLAENKDSVMIPVSMGDHSGIWFYEGHREHECDPGGWDSGGIGWLYVSREKLLKEYSVKILTAKVRKKALEVLRNELKTWDDYVRGNVYGYVVSNEDDEHIDSCWGFYPDENGDYEYCLSEARSSVDGLVESRRKSHF